jgi:hypothetical protein
VPRKIPDSFEQHNHHRLNKSLFLYWYLWHMALIYLVTIGTCPFLGLWYFIFIFFQVFPVCWHKDCHTTIRQHYHLHFLVSKNPVWWVFVHCSKNVLHLCAWKRTCVCVCVCVIVAMGNVQIEGDTFLSVMKERNTCSMIAQYKYVNNQNLIVLWITSSVSAE